MGIFSRLNIVTLNSGLFSQNATFNHILGTLNLLVHSGQAQARVPKLASDCLTKIKTKHKPLEIP